MALLNAKTRHIEAKLVYYGTALGGKTTNLLVLHRLSEPRQKQKLVSLNTAGDRTLFFDLMPFELGRILDWRIRLKLYTLPGQPEYNETRRVVLAGADGVVFVADSTPARAEENARSVNFFKQNCLQNHIDPDTIPLVFQYNKRDIPEALSSASLEATLNWRRAPYFLATAIRGPGVLETFEEAVAQVAVSLLQRFGARARAPVLPEQVRAEVHRELLPLYQARGQCAEDSGARPGATSSHVVLTREGTPGAPEPAPRRLLDTRDLLETALENEMRLLNEMLERDAAEAASAPAAPSLDPARLVAALGSAGEGQGLEAGSRAFLELACETAGVSQGSVLLLTPGDGRLAEAACRDLAHDPLNVVLRPGLVPIARRLAGEHQARCGRELQQIAHGSAILRPDHPCPHALVPLAALGRRLGVLLLYAQPGEPPPGPERMAALEAIAAVLALVLTVRAMERRGQGEPDLQPPRPQALPAPALAGAARRA